MAASCPPARPRRPLPRSISVRNLFPHEGRPRAVRTLASDLAALPSVEARCALASRAVLRRLRLDVILADEQDGEDEEAGRAGTVVRARCQAQRAAHPRWDLRDVAAALPPLDNEGARYYRARLVVLDDRDDDRARAEVSRSSSPTTSDADEGAEWVLAEVPLHPDGLRRLPAAVGGRGVDVDDRPGRPDDGDDGMVVPPSLPPNTLLLHYNDGHTRVLPRVYDLLVRRGIVVEDVRDLVRSRQEGHAEGDLFEEKAFAALGGGPPGARPDRSVVVAADEERAFAALRETDASGDSARSPPGDEKSGAVVPDTTAPQSQSIFDASALDLLGPPASGGVAESTGTFTTEEAGEGDAATSAAGEKTEPLAVAAEADDRMSVEETAPSDARAVAATGTAEEGEEGGNGEARAKGRERGKVGEGRAMPVATATATSPPPLPSRSTTGEGPATTTAAEVEELRRLVRQEQRLLEEEEQRALQQMNHIKSAMHQVQQLEKKTFEVMRAVGVERTHLFRAEFRLEAHRIHLLQQLRLIFPIKVTDHLAQYPQHHYTISGVPLPYDVHDPAITDEQVSTALGFLCHLVALTSKYLAVPLRYSIVCKWSRSAILFDEGSRRRRVPGAAEHGGPAAAVRAASASKVVYPLFRERGVIAPEQLEFGWTLLGRDVDCLLRTRRVDGRSEWHALAKMDRLLTHAIEGEDPSFRGNAG